LPDGTTDFILVDAATGEKRPTFDQQRLAALLPLKLGVKANTDELSFTWNDPARAGSWVRFDSKTRWGSRGRTALSLAQVVVFFAPTVKPMAVDGILAGSAEQAHFPFINKCKGLISLFRISTEGLPTPYGSVGAGKSKTQMTHPGQVWRKTSAANKRTASYLAHNKEAQVVA